MRNESKFSMSTELTNYARKFPVDARGYHVLPCHSLSPEGMRDWMKGLSVTYSLKEAPSSQGILEKWDDKWLYIKTGTSVKKMAYDPEDIQLGVIQFKQGIVFSNTMLTTHQKKKEPEDDVVEEKPLPVVKKTKKKTRKKTTTSYVPKNGIVWS